MLASQLAEGPISRTIPPAVAETVMSKALNRFVQRTVPSVTR
jgi:hypothetical protein